MLALATARTPPFVYRRRPRPIMDGLVAWFRYGHLITVTGAGVSQWGDFTGLGHHLKQGTDTNRPALQADGSILFDGVDNYLKCDAFTLNQPTTIYLLMRQVSWVSNRIFFEGNTSPTGRIRQRTSEPDLGLTSDAITYVAANPPLAVGVYGVLAAVLNGASSVFQTNNNAPATGSTGTASNMGGFTLGSGTGGSAGDYSNIQVKEVLIYSGAHGAATRFHNRNYLKYVGQLPS